VQHWVQTDLILSNGFIVTSLLWGATLALLIDRRVWASVATVLLAAVFAWFGVIHSPLPDSPILPPAQAIARLHESGRFAASKRQTPYHWAAAYVAMAVAIAAVGVTGRPPSKPAEDHPNDT
jgi:AGZA family xanthine/uracil permease-like MFS transporter